jgi:hypothetical protein
MIPAGGTDPLDTLFSIAAIIIGAGIIMVLAGGAFQAWCRWSDNRRIKRHLRS